MILAAIEGTLGIGACIGAAIAAIGAGIGIGKIGASAMEAYRSPARSYRRHPQ